LCLEITDNPGKNENEPGIVFIGLHHAREWPSVNICLYIADQLTSQYGTNQTITDIVDNRRLWIIPCLNPDGYNYDIGEYPDPDDGQNWRKNMQDNNNHGVFKEEDDGVDPYRNYGGSCDGDMRGPWGTITGTDIDEFTSHDPGVEVYCGPEPFSEKESQAIRKIFLENDICASINWHTCGEQVFWPWGYTKKGRTPDDQYLSDVGRNISQRITKMDGSDTYEPLQGGNLWQNTGGLMDWSYGYGHYIQGRPTFSYTIETCPCDPLPSVKQFHPEEKYLDQICRENFDGAFYLLQEAENISKKVLPRVLPPVIDPITYNKDGDYTVSWNEQNPEAAPEYFQLDELTKLSYSIDDGKSSLIWSNSTDDWIYSSPAVADGKVYVGSDDRYIYCLDADNGDYIWSNITGGYVRSSPAVADGKVYVGSNDMNVYCLDADNGDYFWSYTTTGSVRSSPAVSDGKVYVGSMDGKVYCLDADNGDYFWSYTTTGSVRSSPAVSDGKIYFGSDNQNIYCLDADNGGYIWSKPTNGIVESSPAVADGKVYIGSNDDNIYCFNADNGDIIWIFPTDGDVISSPAFADGRIYVGSGDDYFYCLDAEGNGDGTTDRIWSYLTDGSVDSSPAVADDKVYVGSDDRNIYCFTKYGDPFWKNPTKGAVRSSPVVADGLVYVGSSDNNIYCFLPSSLWYIEGFTLSDKNYHSEYSSYYSGMGNYFQSSMRTTYSVPVTKGTELSFWCWFETHSIDRAFVEVSRDGRCYDIIGNFSGDSDGWIYKNFSLDKYYDDSIFIRFRYTTDKEPPVKEGFYVDDIMFIADFNETTTLSDSITNHHYNINEKPPGIYFYRVRGYNSSRGWGDFSALKGISVGTTPPDKPTIDGPSSGKPRIKYEYTFSADDPEDHEVSYFINWGDGTYDGWTDYVESETEVKLEHTWTEKITYTYTIKAKAKDIYGAESGWAEFEVKIKPRNKPFSFNFNLLSWLFERYPHLFPILRFIFGFQ